MGRVDQAGRCMAGRAEPSTVDHRADQTGSVTSLVVGVEVWVGCSLASYLVPWLAQRLLVPSASVAEASETVVEDRTGQNRAVLHHGFVSVRMRVLSSLQQGIVGSFVLLVVLGLMSVQDSYQLLQRK